MLFRSAAEPPEEPPGTHFKSQGLLVGPKKEFSVDEPKANSSIFAFKLKIVAPESFSFLMTVASYGGLNPSRILEQHSVFNPSVQILSLMVTGMLFNEALVTGLFGFIGAVLPGCCVLT